MTRYNSVIVTVVLILIAVVLWVFLFGPFTVGR